MQSLRLLPRLPASRLGLRSIQPCIQLRTATSSSTTSASGPTRRSVTITNDTGRVPWSELSWRERGARTTQQSANLAVILLGLAMTGGVATVLYLEVFSSDSKTAVYNRAFERVRTDPKCIEVLAGRGKGGEIEAWGENRVRNSRFARDSIASKSETDGIGTKHMRMHFHVGGSLATGVVNVHMTKRRDESDFKYHQLALDVPGHERIWLENAEAWKLDKRSSGKMFGVRWW
ncbi:hypothetical protein E4T52_09786 [Aureobasidium sp. EXF-3400]|nr:hypothetical protein E4T51_12126 [Aureobasidium sp. EXF-12344]KAI4775263.1 hypothetical protein E4T52_09786 [Aureobasidium sp. EXF-3400]